MVILRVENELSQVRTGLNSFLTRFRLGSIVFGFRFTLTEFVQSYICDQIRVHCLKRVFKFVQAKLVLSLNTLTLNLVLSLCRTKTTSFANSLRESCLARSANKSLMTIIRVCAQLCFYFYFRAYVWVCVCCLKFMFEFI